LWERGIWLSTIPSLFESYPGFEIDFVLREMPSISIVLDVDVDRYSALVRLKGMRDLKTGAMIQGGIARVDAFDLLACHIFNYFPPDWEKTSLHEALERKLNDSSCVVSRNEPLGQAQGFIRDLNKFLHGDE
jgi:hypothetical protein